MMFGKFQSATAAAAIALIASFGAGSAHATDLVVNVAGIQSFGEEGDAANVLRTFNIGAGSHVTGISYNVNVTAFDPSWLSELTVSFVNTAGDGVVFNPGFENEDPGTASYADSADLVSFGLDFVVGADGLLHLEFFEGFDDDSVNPDGIWNSGSLTFTYSAVTPAVPEPETYALMLAGLGIVGWAARRRKVV